MAMANRWAWASVLALVACGMAVAQAQPRLSREMGLQGIGEQAGDRFETGLLSPKSAAFSPDGSRLYVNALEAGQTLVFDAQSLRRVATVVHRFGPAEAALFQGQSTVAGYSLSREMPQQRPNEFVGKPVEMAFSHGGRFLWVPYYRRSTDPRAAEPSAVAVIDTRTQRILRVLPTGPLPKFVAVSPDSRRVAVVHWGDNSVLVLDTSGDIPSAWRTVGHWTVEKRLNLAQVGGNRDKNCGFCLRGAVFTADGRRLLVARMGGGGIAGFDTASGRYLGTVSRVPATPRHLALSRDGRTLWVTSNVSGVLSRYRTADILAALDSAEGRTVPGPGGEALAVGAGARTVAISRDERWAFVAANGTRQIVAVDLHAWRVVARAPASPFPVGLAVSPDGCSVVSTSQGRAGQGGGNRVDVFRWSACARTGR